MGMQIESLVTGKVTKIKPGERIEGLISSSGQLMFNVKVNGPNQGFSYFYFDANDDADDRFVPKNTIIMLENNLILRGTF